MKSVAELAREAGFHVTDRGRIWTNQQLGVHITGGIENFAALHKAEVIKELCAGEEPVYQLRYTDGRFPAYWTELTELDYQHRDQREGCEFRILYPASTVAALQARVAELEKKLCLICGQ